MDHLGDDEYQTFFLFFYPSSKIFTTMSFLVCIQEIDPYLGAITINIEVTRLDANINDAKILFRCAELALMWQGVDAASIGVDPHFLLVIFCPTRRPSCPARPSSQPIEPLSAQVSSRATASRAPLA